jgi:hypothetical protein
MALSMGVRASEGSHLMKLHRLVRLAFLLPGVIALTGCREILVSPPPDFDPPVVTPGVQPPPPSGPGAPQSPSSSGIAALRGDPLLAGAALQPRKPARAWRYIIIHHSDTPAGSAARFDRAHKARGWEMLGYDFVIGNGSETGDGLIEVGPRWTWQLDGAHTGTPDHRFNEYGIGICLVGNFDITRPTARQIDSLARLCAILMRTYNIPTKSILGHRDCKSTACPGRYMDVNQVRKLAASYAGK